MKSFFTHYRWQKIRIFEEDFLKTYANLKLVAFLKHKKITLTSLTKTTVLAASKWRRVSEYELWLQTFWLCPFNLKVPLVESLFAGLVAKYKKSTEVWQKIQKILGSFWAKTIHSYFLVNFHLVNFVQDCPRLGSTLRRINSAGSTLYKVNCPLGQLFFRSTVCWVSSRTGQFFAGLYFLNANLLD